MPKFQKPCLTCGALSVNSYCDTHRKERERQREAGRAGRPSRLRKSGLYNYAYRKEAKRIKAEATHCHLCGKAFLEGDRIEADHLIAGLQGGPLGAAHSYCNAKRGNKPLEGLL